MNARLEEFLRGTSANVAISIARYSPYVQHLDQVSTSFGQLLAAPCVRGTSAAVFFAMSYGSFLAGCGLGLSGQASPTYMVARGCLESSLYGFWIYSHPEKFKVWAERHESPEAKRKVRDQFQIGPMIKELESVEESISNQFRVAYDNTIDFGGHPNYLAVLTNLENDARGEAHWMAVASDPTVVRQSLYALGFAGLSALAVATATFQELLAPSAFARELPQTWESWNQLQDPASEGPNGQDPGVV